MQVPTAVLIHRASQARVCHELARLWTIVRKEWTTKLWWKRQRHPGHEACRRPAWPRDQGGQVTGRSRHPIGRSTTRRFRTDTASFRAATVAWLYQCRAA